LKLTSDDLLAFGIIDEVIPEPLGGAHRDAAGTVARVLDAVAHALDALDTVPPNDLRDGRYRKFRRIGAAVS
jgi:acetyl-CoA carboxylase alpha subunit